MGAPVLGGVFLAAGVIPFVLSAIFGAKRKSACFRLAVVLLGALAIGFVVARSLASASVLTPRENVVSRTAGASMDTLLDLQSQVMVLQAVAQQQQDAARQLRAFH